MRAKDIKLYMPRNDGFAASSPQPVRGLELAISMGWVPKIVPRRLAPALQNRASSNASKHDGWSIADYVEKAVVELPPWTHGYSRLKKFAEDCRTQLIVAYWGLGSGPIPKFDMILPYESYVRYWKALDGADVHDGAHTD